MQKLYILTALFTAAKEQFQMYWDPERSNFSYSKPRILILEGSVPSILDEVALEARSLFGLAGLNVPHQVRLVEVDYNNGRICAATAAGKEWVAA